MPPGASAAISGAAGSQSVVISKAGLLCSGNDLRPAVRNPARDFTLITAMPRRTSERRATGLLNAEQHFVASQEPGCPRRVVSSEFG